jgi:hypothetical protein
VAQPVARGARGRALLRSAAKELRLTAKWSEGELRALARGHRRFVTALREALALDRRVRPLAAAHRKFAAFLQCNAS